MEHNTLFKLIYTLILGVVIALFIGVGVSAFYESPAQPDYPNATMYKEESPSSEQSRIEIEKQNKFEQEMKVYSDARQTYERNASIVLLCLAVITIAIGLVFSQKIGFLSDGILLGGLFTLVHALIRGFAADDTKYLFAASTVAVAVVLYLGYRRFGRSLESQPRATSKK